MHLPWADLHVSLQISPNVVTPGISHAPPHPFKPLCCTENSANRMHFLAFLLQRTQKTQKLMVPPSLPLRISWTRLGRIHMYCKHSTDATWLMSTFQPRYPSSAAFSKHSGGSHGVLAGAITLSLASLESFSLPCSHRGQKQDEEAQHPSLNSFSLSPFLSLPSF